MDMSKEGPGPSWKIQDNPCYMVIDMDSDDESSPKEKRARLSSKDNSLMLTDTDKPPVIVTEDDDSDMESTVKTEDESGAKQQVFSIVKETGEFNINNPNASGDTGEQNVGKEPLNDSEDQQISDRAMATGEEHVAVVETPRKRACKNKNIFVLPELKEFENKSKKLIPGKSGNCKNGSSDCNIPGCFLRDIEKSKRYSGKNFNKNKDELAQRIYKLMNETVFNNKMPEKIIVTWNKKFLRTAGSYNIGDKESAKNKSCTMIDISLKVCDSADRIRDTLIHELCHAASWILHGIREPHGKIWKYYAKKSNIVHPELPRVTRCHNYKINYKIYYECVRCKCRIGRYTKSLDTNRFMCAKCKGPLSLVPQTRKDGTPIEPHVRPFARYVQQNYRFIQYQTPDITHKEVIRTLSQEFLALKQMQNP